MSLARRLRSAPAGAALALLALAAALPADAQQSRPSLLSGFDAVLDDCRATPLLKAASGGGLIELAPGKELRIPYGVTFRFRHAVPDADFVLLALQVEGEPVQRAAAREIDERRGCFEVVLPRLPVDRQVVLQETQGLRFSAAKRDSLLQAVDDLRAAVLAGLYAERYNDAFGNPDSMRALALRDLEATGRFTAFDSLYLLGPDSLQVVALGTTIREQLVVRVPDLIDLPDAIDPARFVANALAAVRCDSGATQQRARVQRVRAALAPLLAVSEPDDLNALYVSGALPLPKGLDQGLGEALRAACGQNSDLATRVEGFVRQLTTDDLAVLDAIIETARRIAVQSFLLRATEPFAGATTTLQRYGQLDVSNAFFGEDDARLLTTFSFYPFGMRYGGEIEPHRLEDRILVTVGYAIASTVEDGDEDAADDNAYTLGVSFRLNPLFSVGTGRWFSRDDKNGWYFSLSGDVSSIPGLQQIMARSPNQ